VKVLDQSSPEEKLDARAARDALFQSRMGNSPRGAGSRSRSLLGWVMMLVLAVFVFIMSRQSLQEEGNHPEQAQSADARAEQTRRTWVAIGGWTLLSGVGLFFGSVILAMHLPKIIKGGATRRDDLVVHGIATEGLILTARGVCMLMPWESLTGVLETALSFVFLAEQNRTYIVPKRMLSAEDQRAYRQLFAGCRWKAEGT